MHLNGISIILAQAATATNGVAGWNEAPTLVQKLGPLPIFILMLVIMYFVLIRPQSQQRKKQVKLQESLRPGDKVVTVSGIVGSIITIKDKTVSLRSADAKMEVTRSSITEALERDSEEKSAS